MLLKSMLTLLVSFLCTLGFTQTISPSGPVAFCAGGSVKITASGGNSYKWLLNNNAVNGGTQAALDISVAGEYKVVITRSTGGDTTLGPVTVTQNENPVADFTIGGNNVCSGTAIQFIASPSLGTAPYNYSWNFGDGGTSTSQNPSHTYTSLGCSNFTFTATLTITDAKGCTNSVSKKVEIQQAPDVRISDQDIFTPFSNCDKSPTLSNPSFTLNISNASIGSCITSYTIDWGDGAIQNNVSFPLSHIYTKLGAFNLIVSALGSNGCSNSKTYLVANQSNPAGGLGTLGSTTGLCAPASVPFIISNWQDNSPGTTYVLDFGDGTSITLNHPLNATMTPHTVNHTYTKSSCPANTYTATLRVINACDITPYSAGNIQIRAKPVAAFIAPTSGCVNKSLCFTNTTKAGSFGVNCSAATEYIWDFGDGSNFVTTENACHTYTSAGTYTVTLKTINPCGESSFSKQICIVSPPQSSFNIDVNNGCAPLSVTTTNLSKTTNSCDTLTYKWILTYASSNCGTTNGSAFINSTTSTSENPSFSFTNPGTYTITLEVTNTCGTVSSSKTVVVKKPPTVILNSVPNSCGDVTLTPVANITNCGSGSLTYAWTFTGASITASTNLNPGPVTFSGVGAKTITLAVTNECGTTTVNQNFTVNVLPVVTVPTDTTFCEGTSVAGIPFTATSGATISWTNTKPSIGLKSSGSGDIPSFTATNNTVVPITATINVIARLGNCSTTDVFKIIVNPTSQPPTGTASLSYCKGDVAPALSSTTTGTILWYDNATGGTASTTPPVPQTNLIGTINYYLSSVNSSGCESNRSKITVTIKPVPNISDSSFTNPLTCGASSGSIVLKGLLSNTSYIIHYTKAGNSPATKTITSNSAGTVIISGLSEGTYNKIYVDLNGCLSNEAGPYLLSDPTTPPAPIVSSNGPICSTKDIKLMATSALTGTVSYQWSGPNGFSTTGATPTILNATVNASGDYMVTVKQNNCTSLPASIKVVVNATPVLSGTTNNGPLCDTSSLELKTTAVPVESTYAWSGPAGFNSTDQNPVIPKAITTNAGTYTVTATSIIGSCVSLPASTTVIIKPVPMITGTVVTNPAECITASGTIALQGLTPNTVYLVSFIKNGTPITQSHAAVANGTLTIPNLISGTYSNIQVQLNSCFSNKVGPFTLVDPNPPATPTVNPIGPLCSGNTLNLAATSNETGTKIYNWEGPDNFTAETQNPTIPNITTAAGGDYSVTLIINGCKSQAAIIKVVIHPTPAQPAISANSLVCSGNAITLSTPANADYLYAWTGPNLFTASTANPTIPNASSINAGNYQLQVTSISGNCPSPLASAPVVVKPTPVITSATPANPTACGTATGSILLEGLTSNTSYQVSYNKDGTPITSTIAAAANGSLSIASLTAATYTNIRVTLNGCPSNIKGPFTLADPNPPSAPIATANDTLCSGNTLKLVASSNEPGTKSFLWQGPNNYSSTTPDPSIPNVLTVATGKYLVTVTINNCKSTATSIEVLVNPTPAVPIITTNSPVCSGNTITLSTPNNSDFEYAWSGPNTFTATSFNPGIPSASSINSGNYQLIVTTISGNCPSPLASAPVVINPTPVITSTTPTNPNACGTTTGAIELNGLTAGSTYTVSYKSPNGSAVIVNLIANASGIVKINNLFAGTYTNIVATLNGCPSNTISSVVLTDPNPPAAPNASVISPLCTGDTIRLSATSLINNVTYRWSGPDNFTSTLAAPLRFPAAASHSGKYFVTVTINNCTSLPDSVEVVVNLHPNSPIASSNSPVCREGTLQLNFNTTTTGVVSYSWSGPNNFSSTLQQPVINNVTVAAAGTYTVIAKQLNCFSLASGNTMVVVKPKPVIGNIVVNNPTSCGTYTGSIELRGIIPNKVYMLAYVWNNGSPSVVSATSNPAGVVVIRDLPAGLYNAITLSDNGCASDEAGPFELVNVPATIPTIGSNGPLCAGSNLQLTAALAVSGIVTYEWLGPNGFTSNAQNPTINRVSVAATGTYTVTTILNGCRSSNSIDVVVSPASNGGITAADSTVCLGTNTGLITVTGYTGTIVRWQASTDNGSTWLNLSNTNETLVYTDLTKSTWYRSVVQSGVCPSGNSSVTKITVVSKVDDAQAGADQTLCNQVSVNLKANNPTIGRGAWSQIAGPSASITTAANAVTAITGLQPNEAYTFRWTITGATGCGSSADDIIVINRPAITTANAGIDIDICNFTNTRNITLSGNTYRSFEKGRWIILSQPLPASALLSNADIINPVFTFSKAGVYRLVWVISNDVIAGCSPSTDTITIRASNPPVAGFTIGATQLCAGNPLSVVNSSQNANGYQWLWGDGDTSTFVSGTHRYQVPAQFTIRLIVTNTVGSAVCSDTTRQTVTTLQKIPAQIQVAPGNACVPYNLQLTALNTTGSTSIRWLIYDHGASPSLTTAIGSTVAHTYNFATSDSVKLIVNNTAGCADTAVYRFKVYPVPVTTIEPLQLKTCSHDTVVNYTASTTNTGGEAINYRWYINGGLRGNTNSFAFRFITPVTAPNATVYNIKLLAQNAGFCGDTTLLSQFTVMPLPAAGIKVLPLLIQQQPDYTFTFEDTSAAAPPKYYLWSMGDRSQQTRSTQKIEYTYGDTGIYKVQLHVTDATSGCTNNDSVQVQVQYIPGYLQVPDAICPGCSNNAVKQFLPLGKGLTYYRLRIYTTWGKLLFETTALNADGSPKEAWTAKVDPLANNKQLQQDVYRWEIEARYINNTEWRGMLYPNSSKRVKSGFITVIK